MSRTLIRWLHRRRISRHHMRGGFLHRWFGDHLFNPHLWVLEREGVARAFFWGCLICFSPFFGLHVFLGIAAAMFFRANIPVTLLIQFLTNPATVIFYYPAAYLLGAWILHEPVLYHGQLVQVLRHESWSARIDLLGKVGEPLFLGCFLVGLSTGFLGWSLVRMFWPRKRVVESEKVEKLKS